METLIIVCPKNWSGPHSLQVPSAKCQVGVELRIFKAFRMQCWLSQHYFYLLWPVKPLFCGRLLFLEDGVAPYCNQIILFEFETVQTMISTSSLSLHPSYQRLQRNSVRSPKPCIFSLQHNAAFIRISPGRNLETFVFKSCRLEIGGTCSIRSRNWLDTLALRAYCI